MIPRPLRRALAMAALLALPAALPIPASAATAPRVEPAAVQAGPRVEPELARKLSAGARLRVNVVTRSRADLAAAAGTVGSGQVLQTLSRSPVVTLRADQAALDRLKAQPGVVSVSEDTPVPPVLAQSIPLIGADRTRAAGLTGEGYAVAVLDTGVATHHPFLGGRVTAEACFSPVDADYSATSLCPGGAATQEGAGSADSELGPCADPALDCSHGTHVAGIVAGDGVGVSGAPADGGVAPEAGIVAIQVFSRFDSEDYCGAGAAPCVLSFTSAQLAGLEKAREMSDDGVPIVAANLSLGGGRYTAACDDDPRKPAIDDLLAAGVTTVVAAGNNGYADAVSAPACVSSAFTVGSTTDQDAVSGFSNRGPLLDVFAPGSDIVSSVPGGGWESMSGTSMAAPHVAGAIAVLSQAFPDASAAALQTMITSTGRSITSSGVVKPRLQLDDAALGTTPRPGPDQYFTARGRILDNVQISANSTMTVQVSGAAGLPAQGLAAAALNLSAKGDWFNSGSLVLYPSGEAEPELPTLFYDAARHASTLVIAKVGADGKVKIENRSAQAVRVYLDVHGYTLDHAAAAIGGTHVAIAPARAADRTVVPAWGNVELATSAMTGVPASGVDAVALSVTSKSTSTGTLRVYATGDPYPVDANSDYPANVPTQFFTVVRPGTGGKINIHNLGSAAAEVTVDVTGYYTSAQRGSTVKAIRPAAVASNVAVPAGGTYLLRPGGVADVPSSGVSAVGLAVAAKGGANGLVTVVPQTGSTAVRAVAYAAGKDTSGFATAALRPDGTIVLKNEGTSQVSLSVTVYAYFSGR
ncbi:S8 family peptidase [Nonomuraea roseoviolacea]|uniref:Subtilisin family serine protease n=1 Tax=Nonomuraea roseoviolacea subsp. carminata TaxID=160689 RepID=A0ABT1KAG2_9ACTN|nr:S8 family serine peptidase [Nonomuraea roseoviolacea]MCP2350376.1 subtilisin family serine protease [Nonomuraea roseoviolacea subsp. carminata]